MNINNIDETIETLLAFATEHQDKEQKHTLILLSAQWHDLKTDKKEGTLSTADHDLRQAKIRKALLELADELQTAYGKIPETKNKTIPDIKPQNHNNMNFETLKSNLLDKIERQDLPTVFVELENIYDQMESSERTTYSRLKNEFKFGKFDVDFDGRLKVFVNGLKLKKNLA